MSDGACRVVRPPPFLCTNRLSEPGATLRLPIDGYRSLGEQVGVSQLRSRKPFGRCGFDFGVLPCAGKRGSALDTQETSGC